MRIKKITIEDVKKIVQKVISEQKEVEIEPDTIEEKVRYWNENPCNIVCVFERLESVKDELGGLDLETITEGGLNDDIAIYVNIPDEAKKTVIYDIQSRKFIFNTVENYQIDREEEFVGGAYPEE